MSIDTIFHDTMTVRNSKAMVRCYRLDGPLAGAYVVRLYWFPDRLDLFDHRGSQPFMTGENLHHFPSDARAIRFAIEELDDFVIRKEHLLATQEQEEQRAI